MDNALSRFSTWSEERNCFVVRKSFRKEVYDSTYNFDQSDFIRLQSALACIVAHEVGFAYSVDLVRKIWCNTYESWRRLDKRVWTVLIRLDRKKSYTLEMLRQLAESSTSLSRQVPVYQAPKGLSLTQTEESSRQAETCVHNAWKVPENWKLPVKEYHASSAPDNSVFVLHGLDIVVNHDLYGNELVSCRHHASVSDAPWL